MHAVASRLLVGDKTPEAFVARLGPEAAAAALAAAARLAGVALAALLLEYIWVDQVNLLKRKCSNCPWTSQHKYYYGNVLGNS